MKKIVTFLMAAVLISSLAIVSFAKMPESDFSVYSTTTVPKIDGQFSKSEGWGSPIYSVKGEEAYEYSSSGAKTLYDSWAVLTRPLYFRNDGSVEKIRGMEFTTYARWDAEKIYFCFVVKGLDPFYPNTEGEWWGNSVQITFAPEDRKQNWDPKADDKLKNGKFDGGYVGNEYTLYIGSSGAAGKCYRGKFNQKTSTSMRGLNIQASNSGGTQVYEVAFDWKSIDNGSAKVGTKIPVCIAHNINITPDMLKMDPTTELGYPGYNGFQIGKGIFQQMKSDIMQSDALNIVLVKDDGTGGTGDGKQTETGEPNDKKTSDGDGKKQNNDTSDASALMYALATISALGGAVVLKKRK